MLCAARPAWGHGFKTCATMAVWVVLVVCAALALPLALGSPVCNVFTEELPAAQPLSFCTEYSASSCCSAVDDAAIAAHWAFEVPQTRARAPRRAPARTHTGTGQRHRVPRLRRGASAGSLRAVR